MQKLNIRMVLHIHTLMYTCVISSYTSLRYESDTLKASFSHCLLDNPQCVLPNIGARILYVWRHMIAEKVELDYDITFTRTTETRVKWLGQEQLLSTKVNDPALIQRLLGEGQKLNIEKPSHEKDNHLKTMPKTNDTISISDVSAMLCELGIGLSQHFGLDADEVVQFLDTACEDQLGVNPGTCELFEQVKAEASEDQPNRPTKEQIEEWCQPPNKGGVSIKVLREKASEMNVDVSELKKRSEIKEAMLRGLDDEQSSTNLVVKRNKELGCWVVHVDGEPTNLVVQSYHVKKLVGYITKQGKLSKKIPKTVQEKASKLGLE